MKKKTNKSRKKASLPRVSWSRRLLVKCKHLLLHRYCAAMTYIVIGGLWLHQLGIYQQFSNWTQQKKQQAYEESGTLLKDILLEGHHYTLQQEIEQAMAIKHGHPLLEIDLWAVKQRLEDLPWVHIAIVERLLPSTLSIHIVEHQPYALWQHKGNIKVISDNGYIIPADNLEIFDELILLVGKDAPDYTTGLLEVIHQQPDLAKLVTSAVHVSNRRWNIYLSNNVEIKLPEENSAKAWALLAKKQREEHIFNSNIKRIDLRLENRIFVR